MEIHRSARKHGVSDDDIEHADTNYLIAYTIEDDRPARELRLGFDTPAACWRSSCCCWTTGPNWRSTR